ELLPRRSRQAAAGDALRRRIVVIAEPDAGGQVRSVADEPGVTRSLTGAGLAGGGPAEGGPASGAVQDRLFHHAVHHADDFRADDTRLGLLWEGVKNLARRREDTAD